MTEREKMKSLLVDRTRNLVEGYARKSKCWESVAEKHVAEAMIKLAGEMTDNKPVYRPTKEAVYRPADGGEWCFNENDYLPATAKETARLCVGLLAGSVVMAVALAYGFIWLAGKF
jgi:hypothetical protein